MFNGETEIVLAGILPHASDFLATANGFYWTVLAA